MAKYTQAQREAAARFDAKTYKKFGVALRIDEDADLIASLDEAKKRGMPSREWLRELYEGKKIF